MNQESLEAGPVQRGIPKEQLSEKLPYGWHKFVVEIKADGSIGPLSISARDFMKSRVFPKHADMAEICGLLPEDSLGGILEYRGDGTFTLSSGGGGSVRGRVAPEQFEQAIKASEEQGFTVVSI